MAENKKKEDLEFDGSITKNSNGSAILGRITGPCADIVSATRNGRKYSQQLWEKVFSDPIVNEYFAAGGIFGELNHPADREETDLEKVAICMPKPPVKNSDGKLIGTWDILNTPNGRIAKCLFDYGYKLGISSRGSGDTFTDYDGQESVDPDSYTLQGFDLVYLPAVKAARLTMVNESLDTTKIKFKKALNEALENSTEDERKIMTETLNNLEIDYTPETESIDEETTSKIIPEEDINIAKSENTLAAEDSGADIVNELQEALKTNQELEKQVKKLQEQLSVCYTKETRYETILARTKNELTQAQSEGKLLAEELANTKAAVKAQTRMVEELTKKVNENTTTISTLTEKLKNSSKKHNSLNESLSTKEAEIKTLTTRISNLTESFNRKQTELNNQNEQLKESLANAEKDVKIVRSQADAKLARGQQIVEKYKNIAKTAVDKYIESSATKLGIKVEDVKKQLGESYSFNDIDRVCESLSQYKINMASLPFNVEGKTKAKVKVAIKESAPVVHTTSSINDEVDDILKSFI